MMNLFGFGSMSQWPSKNYNENLISPGKKGNPVRKWKKIWKSSNKQQWGEKENYRLASVSIRNVLEIQDVESEKFSS